MGAIYRRELGSFFNSAIGPVFLTVFYLGSGVLFWLFCLNYARTDMSNYFAWMRLVMVLILPLLTMRLLSEERAQKTDQGLLTAPVSLGGIVLGKYFAALTVYAMGIAIVFVYAILLSFFGTVAWSIVFRTLSPSSSWERRSWQSPCFCLHSQQTSSSLMFWASFLWLSSI